VFRQPAILDSDYIRGDPGGGPAIAREAAVDDDVVAFREDELMLVSQGVGRAPELGGTNRRDPVRCVRYAGCRCPTRSGWPHRSRAC